MKRSDGAIPELKDDGVGPGIVDMDNPDVLADPAIELLAASVHAPKGTMGIWLELD